MNFHSTVYHIKSHFFNLHTKKYQLTVHQSHLNNNLFFFFLSSFEQGLKGQQAVGPVRHFSYGNNFWFPASSTRIHSLIKSLSFSLLLHFGTLRLAPRGAPAFCTLDQYTLNQVVAEQEIGCDFCSACIFQQLIVRRY